MCSPSSSEDYIHDQDESKVDYKLAEKYGREQQHEQDDNHCARIYECNLSILDLMSQIISIS